MRLGGCGGQFYCLRRGRLSLCNTLPDFLGSGYMGLVPDFSLIVLNDVVTRLSISKVAFSGQIIDILFSGNRPECSP